MSFQQGLQGGERLQGLKRLSRHGVWHWPSGSLLFVLPEHCRQAWKKEMESFFVRSSKDVCQWITVAVFLTTAPGCCSTSPVLKLLAAFAPRWHFLSSRNSAEPTFNHACASTVTHSCKRIGI